MIIMNLKSLTRSNLHFILTTNGLNYRQIVFITNKHCQHTGFFRRELRSVVQPINPRFAFLEQIKTHGTHPDSTLSRARSNCSTINTTPVLHTHHAFGSIGSNCKFHKGVTFHNNGCFQWYHVIRRFSVSRLRLTSSGDDTKHGEASHNVIQKLQGLENSLRYHGYSTIRIGLVFAFTVGMCLYIFRESIRENVADEVSQVATRSLEDQVVVGKAEQFAKGLLDAIMNDEQMTRLASEFVVGVLMREETKQATARVLLSVIDDPKTREHLILATKQVFLAALNDEDSQKALKVVFKNILADDETRQAAKDLLAFVFAEDDIRNLVAEFFKNVIQMDIVVKQATELGKNVTHSVISDPVLQKETGDSMWRAMGHSITPRWFSGSPTPQSPPPPPPPAPSPSPPPPSSSQTVSPETGEVEATAIKNVEGKPVDAFQEVEEEEVLTEIDKNLEGHADDFID